MLGNKGFISVTAIYTIFVVFLITLAMMLGVYGNSRVNLESQKSNLKDNLLDYEEEVKNTVIVENQAIKLILDNNGGVEEILNKTTPVFTSNATTNEGMFAAPDDYGTSFYFRGAVDNNWLYFSGIYWRIVRINGDGSIRLIYSGTTAPTSSQSIVKVGTNSTLGQFKFNELIDDNAYVGYMYTLGDRQGYEESSNIKEELENWYIDTISEENQKLIVDNGFCYDRELAESGYQSGDYGFLSYTYNFESEGLGQSGTTYKAVERVTSSSSTIQKGGIGPSLECWDKDDFYTKDDTSNGNGALGEMIGLLTADEAIMAGNTAGSDNSYNYLRIGVNYWLGTPFGYNTITNSANIMYFQNYSKITFNPANGSNIYVRPVISLAPDIVLTGTGEWNDAYKIEQ